MYRAIFILIVVTMMTTGCGGLLPKWYVSTISMPDENKKCMQCHDRVLRERAKEGFRDLHRRHIQSKRMDFDESQKYCITCHEAWEEGTELTNGIDREGIIHPVTAQQPLLYWRSHVQKTEQFKPEPLYFINNESPYLFKPMLQRLVCVECHGPYSSIKDLYHPSEEKGESN